MYSNDKDFIYLIWGCFTDRFLATLKIQDAFEIQ